MSSWDEEDVIGLGVLKIKVTDFLKQLTTLRVSIFGKRIVEEERFVSGDLFAAKMIV